MMDQRSSNKAALVAGAFDGLQLIAMSLAYHCTLTPPEALALLRG